MFDLWLKNWRRRRLIRRPTPPQWPEVLQRRLWYWQHLTSAQQRRLLHLSAIFLREKEIVVPANVRQPDEARLTVAASACLMLLGFEDTYCFDRVQTVILTLRPFRQKIQSSAVDGLFGDLLATGSYERNAPIVLTWPEVKQQCEDPWSSNNVVVHEFAHYIDDLDGALAGDPPFPTRPLVARWKEVADREFELLGKLQAAGIETVIDPYGLEDPVEFFAVCCEAFFCNPLGLEAEHSELFELLRVLFRLDPRAWFHD